MGKNVLENILGIENYPVFSLMVFFLVFSAMLVLVLTMKKSHAVAMGNLPLNDDTVNDEKGDRDHD